MDTVEFTLNGSDVEVSSSGSLLDTLRERLDIRSVKDGCSPQGQCGCCTVWVDGSPRVSCVTPVSRVAGRSVTTVEGLANADRWAAEFCGVAAAQCGFCTPGIIMRLAALPEDALDDQAAVRRALLGHVCRCTGWQPIVDAAAAVGSEIPAPSRDLDRARERAAIEGRYPQTVDPIVALGGGGFADDTSPLDTPVALRTPGGEWRMAAHLADARREVGKVQGRRSTTDIEWPVGLPTGEFVRTLQTTWVEPAYLEPDASWCRPGGLAASSLGNGGAFGGKESTEVEGVATELATRSGQPVRVMYSREDVVRLGPKRPPLAIGLRGDGSGVVRVGVSPHSSRIDLDPYRERWPNFEFETASIIGPPVSLAIRSAIDAELHAVVASTQSGPDYTVTTTDGATASARIDDEGISVNIECGIVLDEPVLVSYCCGAAHMALGLVTSEAVRLVDGEPCDLTMRSFGIVRAVDTPPIRVTIIPSDRRAVNGSDAVFAAVAAAAWASRGHPPRWPTDRT